MKICIFDLESFGVWNAKQRLKMVDADLENLFDELGQHYRFDIQIQINDAFIEREALQTEIKGQIGVYIFGWINK